MRCIMTDYLDMYVTYADYYEYRQALWVYQNHTIKIGPIVEATAWPAEAAICMKLVSIINRKDWTFK